MFCLTVGFFFLFAPFVLHNLPVHCRFYPHFPFMIWGSLNTLSGYSVCPFQIFNRILLYYVLNMLLDYVLNCHLPPDLIIVISCLSSRQHFYILGRSLKQTKLDNRRSVPGETGHSHGDTKYRRSQHPVNQVPRAGSLGVLL